MLVLGKANSQNGFSFGPYLPKNKMFDNEKNMRSIFHFYGLAIVYQVLSLPKLSLQLKNISHSLSFACFLWEVGTTSQAILWKCYTFHFVHLGEMKPLPLPCPWLLCMCVCVSVTSDDSVPCSQSPLLCFHLKFM